MQAGITGNTAGRSAGDHSVQTPLSPRALTNMFPPCMEKFMKDSNAATGREGQQHTCRLLSRTPTPPSSSASCTRMRYKFHQVLTDFDQFFCTKQRLVFDLRLVSVQIAEHAATQTVGFQSCCQAPS